MNTELSELVEVLRGASPAIAGVFRLSHDEAVERLAGYFARQNTHEAALKDIGIALKSLGEKDSAGVYPIDYVCCPDGVRSIGDRINEALGHSTAQEGVSLCVSASHG